MASVNATIYCEQLDRVHKKLMEKYQLIGLALFQQDNARPHVAKKTREKFEELD